MDGSLGKASIGRARQGRGMPEDQTSTPDLDLDLDLVPYSDLDPRYNRDT